MHGVPLKEDTVPVRGGGDVPTPKRYHQAMKELFPNAKPFQLGTCESDDPPRARVRYCPECRAALVEWIGRTRLNAEERSLLGEWIDMKRGKGD